MPLTVEQIEKIKSDFSEDATIIYKRVKGKHGEYREFTGRAAPYIIERLNDIFGHTWSSEVVEWKAYEKWGIVAVVRLTYFDESGQQYYHTQGGGCQWMPAKTGYDVGETLKGAITNALMKASSMLGVGLDAYKGELEATNKARELYREELPLSEWQDATMNLASKKGLVNKKEISKYAYKLAKGGVLDPSTYKKFPKGEDKLFDFEAFKEFDWQKLQSVLKLELPEK